MKKMMILVLSCLVTLLGPAPADDGDGKRVGKLGDPSRLFFQGNETFTEKMIRNGFSMNPHYWAAAHPLASRAFYVDRVREMILEGYRSNGFPKVRVEVLVHEYSDAITLEVSEGPQYQSGDIVLSGGRSLTLEDIKKEFQEKEPESEEALWVPGQPARLDAVYRDRLSKRIMRVFMEHGFFNPKAELRIEFDHDAKIAQLVVHVDDEGVPAVLEKIEVEGLEKNTRKDLLDYLQLEPGMAFTSRTLDDLQERLFLSGRFLSWNIGRITSANEPRQLYNLYLRLDEYEEATPLMETYTPVEQAALNWRNWLTRIKEEGLDLVFSVALPAYGVEEAELVISFTQGSIIRFKGEVGSGKIRLDHVGILDLDRTALYSMSRERCMVADGTPHQFNIGLRMYSQPKTEEGSFGFHTSYSFSARDLDALTPPVQVDLDLAPAAFLGLANNLKDRITFTDDHLVLGDDLFQMRLQAETGRMLDLEFTLDEYGVSGKLSFEKGAYDRKLQEIEEKTHSFRNVYSEGHLLSSLLRFLAEEHLLSGLESEKVLAALGKLLDPGIFQPVAKHINRPKKDRKRGFFIPFEVKEEDFVNELVGVSYLIHFFVAPFMPEDSWVRKMSREIFFITMGNKKYTDQAIVDLFDYEKMGPLGFLAAARLLQFVDAAKAKAFAIRASKRMTLDEFHKDCRMLLDGPSPLGDCLRNFCDVLCALGDDEVETLAEEVLLKEDEPILFSLVETLKAGKDKPLIEVFPSSLDALWTLRLKELCTEAAEKLKESS